MCLVACDPGKRILTFDEWKEMDSGLNAVDHRMTYNGGSYAKGGMFTTFTGRLINPIDPDPDQIVIEDIAHALSNACRFGGHCSEFYSVAQHSVLVSYISGWEHQLDGLLHDASEAYLSDIVRPVKYTAAMESYRTIEANLERVIAQKFGLQHPMPAGVKKADDQMVVSEGYALFDPIPEWVTNTLRDKYDDKLPIIFALEDPFWSPKKAKVLFLSRYEELTKNA